jgi:hypothetical protein
MTSVNGIPYIMVTNVIYKLDLKTKQWLAAARIPSIGNNAYYRVRLV